MKNAAPIRPLCYDKIYERGNDIWRIVKYETTDEGEITEDHLATVDTETMADMLIAVLDSPFIAISVQGGRVRDILCPPNLVPQLRILVVDHDIDTSNPDQQSEHTRYTDAEGNSLLVNICQPEMLPAGHATNVELALTAYFDSARFHLG